MNVNRWLRAHSLKLLAIRDTPEAIAGGIAIGFFFGFTPLFGLKTVCAIFFAWITRCNIIAAVLAGTLHDVALPVMPVIFMWEYKIGYWMMHQEWPAHVTRARVHWRDMLKWTTFLQWRAFLKVGLPWLLGSFILGVPVATISYFITRPIVARYHRKHPHPPPVEDGVEP